MNACLRSPHRYAAKLALCLRCLFRYTTKSVIYRRRLIRYTFDCVPYVNRRHKYTSKIEPYLNRSFKYTIKIEPYLNRRFTYNPKNGPCPHGLCRCSFEPGISSLLLQNVIRRLKQRKTPGSCKGATIGCDFFNFYLAFLPQILL